MDWLIKNDLWRLYGFKNGILSGLLAALPPIVDELEHHFNNRENKFLFRDYALEISEDWEVATSGTN